MNAADRDTARATAEQHDKQVATLKARAALGGYELHIINGANGEAEFLVFRWGLSATLKRVEDVEDFLRRVGAPE